MISIQKAEGQLAVHPEDRATHAKLDQPLHRLFVLGTLNGTQDDRGYWSVPLGEKEYEQINRLTAYLERHDLDYVLDQASQEVVDRAEAEQAEHAQLLEGALRVKADRDSDRAALQDSLGSEFVRILTDDQLCALEHLTVIKNGANFSVPGSGKTSVILAYFHLLRQSDAVDALLVVSPISAFRPWEDEYAACFGRPAVAARLPGRGRSDRGEIYLTAGDYDLLLTSYHTAARDLSQLSQLLDRRRYLLVLDESHYVKRPVGGQLADAMLALAPHAARRVILTGTPMPNGLADIWSQMTFLWPERRPLGTADSYLMQVRRVDADELLESVRTDIDPIFFRVSKRDLNLPAPRFKIVRCNLEPAQARIYRGVAERFLVQTREAPKDQDALMMWRRARAVRLLQIASNPALLSKSTQEFTLPPLRIESEGLRSIIERYAEFEVPSKINQVCAIARETADNDRKILIWSVFVHNLEMLREHLADLKPAIIHGGVPYGASDRDELTREAEIDRFKQDPECKALIANPAACAESISLHTVCHDAVYLDRSFNCAHYLQSLDRIHRLGLPADQDTTYYLLIGEGTIDEIVDARLTEKIRRLHDLVEGDLPGAVPGYWGDETEEESARDFGLVEEHIRSLGAT